MPYLTGPVFLVHGEDDTMIPPGESAKLAAALGSRAELHLVKRFAHVDAGTNGLATACGLEAAIRILESATGLRDLYP